MRHAIQSIQTSQIVRWRVVNKSAVFSSDEEMVGKIDIGPTPVDKRGPGLRIRAQANPNRLEGVMVNPAWAARPREVVWTENQGTRACKHKR